MGSLQDKFNNHNEIVIVRNIFLATCSQRFGGFCPIHAGTGSNPHMIYLPLLVSTTEPGQNHLSEAAGPVQFGLTFGPLDGALQPSIEKTLKIQQGNIGGKI